LQGAVKRIEAQSAKLKQQIAENSARQQPQEDWKAAVAQAKEDSDALRRELAAATAQIAALQKQAAENPARQQSQDDLTAAIAQANEGNTALRRELSAAKEKIAALQNQVTAQNDRAALQGEIARLKQENVELGDKVSALQSDSAAMQQRLSEIAPPPPPSSPPAAVPPDKKDELKLPSREDMERMRAALNDAWQRVMDMILQLQKDLTRKDDSSVRL
jgi:chromosome segregation ATPase